MVIDDGTMLLAYIRALLLSIVLDAREQASSHPKPNSFFNLCQ